VDVKIRWDKGGTRQVENYIRFMEIKFKSKEIFIHKKTVSSPKESADCV
jgi:hypothetical protein